MDKIEKPNEEVWRVALDTLIKRLPSHAINTWFAPIVPISIINDKIDLSVPSQFFSEWIESHYGDQLLSAVRLAFKSEQSTYQLLISKEKKLVKELEIPSGQTFGLIGNNGAGKTTLFSCLLDLIKPTKGKVINNDVEVSTSEDWKSFTTAFLDETFLIGYLMPEEYFYFIGELRGLSKIQVNNFVLKFEDFFHGEI